MYKFSRDKFSTQPSGTRNRSVSDFSDITKSNPDCDY